MLRTDDSLRQVLLNFEQWGWNVNYQELSMYARPFRHMKHVELSHSLVLDPVDDEFFIYHRARVRHPHGKSAVAFLECLRQALDEHNIDISWEERAVVDVTWSKEFPDPYKDFKKKMLTEEIKHSIFVGRAFLYNCAHVLTMYARMEQKEIELPHHMSPRIQVMFCTVGLTDGLVLLS